MTRYLRQLHAVLDRGLANGFPLRGSAGPAVLRSAQRNFRSCVAFNAGEKGALQTNIDTSRSKVIISRVMGPDDTQMYGMVHGGVVMQLLEEAGTILTTQYCNTNGQAGGGGGGGGGGEKVVTVSGCIESAALMKSMFVGEVAEVHAEVAFTSKHSIQVNVEVFAKNIVTGDQPRLTSKAKIWYVAMTSGKEKKLVEVPQMVCSDPKVEEEGKKTYEALKTLRDKVIRPRLDTRPLAPEDLKDVPHDPERGSVNYSRAVTRHAIHPSHCWAGETYLRGGMAMKWMDEAGALTASLHSAHASFTVGVDTIMFLRKLKLGAMLVSTSKPIFVSGRSMDILITGDELSLHPGKGILYQRAVEAVYTFVAPDKKGRARELPPLKLKTDEEKRLFEERRQLYEKKIKERK